MLVIFKNSPPLFYICYWGGGQRPASRSQLSFRRVAPRGLITAWQCSHMPTESSFRPWETVQVFIAPAFPLSRTAQPSCRLTVRLVPLCSPPFAPPVLSGRLSVPSDSSSEVISSGTFLGALYSSRSQLSLSSLVLCVPACQVLQLIFPHFLRAVRAGNPHVFPPPPTFLSWLAHAWHLVCVPCGLREA